jgi:hypothetical protein
MTWIDAEPPAVTLNTTSSMSNDKTTSNASTPDDAETGNSSSDTEQNDHEDCHETVDPATRKKVLERDRHRCKGLGEHGPGRGGLADLEVHHIERDPDGMDQHDLTNLITLCSSCHSWLHQQPEREEVPVELTEADDQELSSHDKEILMVLDEIGPAMASDVADELTVDLSVLAVRARLWKIAGLDNEIDSRDRQLVDQDASSGEWGLTAQIANSSRGHISDDTQTLLRRASDERVRQALDRGIDRQTVADVFDVHRRTTFIKQKRARAYDLPLDALTDAGGRPTADPDDGDDTDGHVPGVGDAADEQQEQLTSLTAPASDNAAEQEPGDHSSEAASEGMAAESDAVRETLQEVLDAIEGVEHALRED